MASMCTSMRLSAHFGRWLEVGHRGQKARRWQVAADLIYGQVQKSYRQRTPAMAAGKTSRQWSTREVLCYPLPPLPCFTI